MTKDLTEIIDDPRCPFCREDMEEERETHLWCNHAWTCPHCGCICLMPRAVDGYRRDGTYLYEAAEY